ncbi:MAG TPA: hypothetical protein VLL97_13090 [Acidobacteriota bacterium]|nr:hypothetical protein [Acidobacteriota bacterium]
MRISRFDRERDYPDMVNAWDAYDWTPAPPDVLPRMGFVARTSSDSQFLAYMGIYLDEGGNVGMPEWTVANPDVECELTSKALENLFNVCKRTAQARGFLYLMSFTANKGWGRKLKSYGMTEGEKDCTTYVMGVEDDVKIDFMLDGGSNG